MLDEMPQLPEDPEELRAFTALLLAEVMAQAVLIEKLRHQFVGRFGVNQIVRPRLACTFFERFFRSPQSLAIVLGPMACSAASSRTGLADRR